MKTLTPVCFSLINLEKRLLCDCMHNLEIPNQGVEPAPAGVESLEEEEGLLEDDGEDDDEEGEGLLEDDGLILLGGDSVCGNFLVR